MSKVTKITEEQLKTIKDQQAKLQAAFINIGFIESKKHEALHIQVQAAETLEATKKELEEEYGQINIDLSDGSYTIVEKNEAQPVMEKV
ncbi:MAG: poly(A) polymerase Pap1 [Patiriisocius sp.]|jgi:poly(A) polymerase Pap1|tara:strand:- start:18 stop:284 length:267 start_codon:yes stop_codon:yes gene_type:complete